MNRITKIFNEPFPLDDNPKTQLLSNFGISLFVTAFLFYFKPFGLRALDLPLVKIFPIYLGYGVVTFLVLVLADRLIRPAFPLFFDEVEWSIGKNILWTVFEIMLIGLANLFYSSALGFTGISGSSLLMFQFFTVVVAIFPVTVLTLIRWITLLTKNLKEVKKINNSLLEPLVSPNSEPPLIFSSENLKDEIRIIPNQFLFAESADNYTDIVYIENGIVKRALIRSTLKRIEDMNTTPYIIRVHRTFLVNLRKVKQAEGNSQGYRLVFDNIDETVPVARRNSPQVKQMLSQIHLK